ncbi:hypothetical protein ACVMB1_000231 [Bradyrhizobium sp. USDA 4504]
MQRPIRLILEPCSALSSRSLATPSQPRDLDGNESRHGISAHSPLARLSTPGEQQAMSHPVPACHPRRPSRRAARSLRQANLLVVTPSPPTLGAQHIDLHSQRDLKARLMGWSSRDPAPPAKNKEPHHVCCKHCDRRDWYRYRQNSYRVVATTRVAPSCCGQSGRVTKWKLDSPICRVASSAWRPASVHCSASIWMGRRGNLDGESVSRRSDDCRADCRAQEFC